MNLENFILISAAGFLASYVHLVMALWAPKIGLPQLNFSKALSNLSFGSDDYNEKPPYLLGMAFVQLNGIVFALLYSLEIGPLLPGTPFIRGLIYGGILLIGSQCFFVPVFLNKGIFLSKLHPRAWITAVMAHGIYGGLLGWLCPIL
jgi:hypothetical protein